MTEEERSGSGLVVAAVVGGIGCLLLLLLVGGFMLFGFRASSSGVVMTSPTVPPPVEEGQGEEAPLARHESTRETEAGPLELVWHTAPDGTVRRLERRAEEDGFFSDLRASWKADGSLDPDASGAYDAGQRLRALTPEEVATVERERALLATDGQGD